MMTDEDQVHFSSSPDQEKMGIRIEEDIENDYKKARDTKLPISERGDAFTRICEAASRSQEIDTETRKAALGHAINLSTELGTERSASILTELLFDPSPEIRTIILANVSAFVEKTGDNNFEAIIYDVVENIAGTDEQPSSISGEESKALQTAAKHLMRSYSRQFFSALFAPISVSKGSLKWLAINYPKLKAEVFSDGSEDGAKADRALMAALKSASAQLTDTIDKAMLAMDAMNTVVKSVQSVLGIYSDLLRVSGDSGVVIVSTALTSNVTNQNVGVRRDQPHTPETANSEYPRRRTRGRDSSVSQISPKSLSSNTRLFSSRIDMRGEVPSTPVSRQHGIETDISDDLAAPPYTSSSRIISPRSSAHHASTPTVRQQRSSSAPPIATPSKRTFGETETRIGEDSGLKRPRKEGNSPKAPSPTHRLQGNNSTGNQGGSEPYRGSGRSRYQGRNFIPNYVPNYRGRASYRGRDTYRSSYSWRGRQPQWGGRGERGEYQGSYRGTDYPSRMNYD